MEGWISLHRQIIENELYFSEKFTRSSAWIDLLLLANHKGGVQFIHGVEVVLKPGDLCYSQISLATRWKWNFKTVKKFLDFLVDREMITYKGGKVTTIISIKNWKKYQNYGEALEADNKGRNAVLGGYEGEQDGEQKENRTETNNNDNNVNNKKPKTFNQYSLPNELNNNQDKEAWQRWIEYRAERKKGITLSTAKLQLGKLVEYQAKGMSAIDIINQSIEKGWLGLFPIKQDKPKEQITSGLRLLTKDEPAWL